MDSQSIKTTGVGGEVRGYDGGKKVKGRKRHLLVDTQGLVLKVKVHGAAVMDREGIKPLLGCVVDRFPRLSHLWLDAGYNGQDKARLGGEGTGMDGTDSMLPTEAGTGGGNEEVGKRMRQRECSDRSGGALFGAKKVRGSASPVGGRAALFLAGTKQADEKDYEFLAATSEAFVYVTMSCLMVRRLARS